MSQPLSPPLAEKRDRLLAELRRYGSCLVAFSAGVDSTVVAKAAQLALGSSAVAATGVSLSLATHERQAAETLARQIGIRHEWIATNELADPNYVRNAPDRCYFCKTELYTHLEAMADRLGLAVIANGANLDDRGDHRPGMQAAAEHRVRSPLLECGLNKSEVRQLAADWGLPIWDKPASPCLSSRVAYGEAVTPQRLAMIEAAEAFLHEHGFRELRVRYHGGDLARLEVPVDELPRLVEPALRRAVLQRLAELGFKYVTVDLQGFRSGSLNVLIPPEALRLHR